MNNFVDDYYGINTTVDPQHRRPHGHHRPWHRHGGDHRRRGQQQQRHGRRQLANQDHGPQVHDHHWHGGQRHHLHQLCPVAEGPQREATPLVLTLGWSQSPSYTYSNALHDALRIAQDAGALVVAAAGNNNEDNDIFPNFPSSYNHDVKDFAIPGVPVNPANITLDNIISVGASDQFDRKETNSSYGMATVDLFAPGKNIVCTLPGNKYGSGTGTSYAAAHVAGACALLWSQYPDKDWKQIKALILNGAEDGTAQDFRTICVSEGRLESGKFPESGHRERPGRLLHLRSTPHSRYRSCHRSGPGRYQ